MYTEQDTIRAKKAVKKDLLWLCAVAAALIAAMALGISGQSRPVTYAAAALLFIAVCFSWGMFLGPHVRYRWFLRDMERGLTRTVECTIESVDEKTGMQDGVEVRAVHVLLDQEGDQRILYIAADKARFLPAPGEHMKADCYGRHIRGLED